MKTLSPKTVRSNRAEIPLEIINEMNVEATKNSANEEKNLSNHSIISKKPTLLSSLIEGSELNSSIRSTNRINNQNDNNSSISPPIVKKNKNYLKTYQKKNSIKKEPLEVWRDLCINEIINEKKFQCLDDKEVLFSSDLYKFIEDNKNNSGAYSHLFAVITRHEIK